jgi:hypothetical protein
MSLSPEQRNLLQLMRSDCAAAGFPFAASKFWAGEAEYFEHWFEAIGISDVQHGYFNTRFSGVMMNDPRLYEWFICTFSHLLRSRDRLGLMDRFEVAPARATAQSGTKDGVELQYGVPVIVDGRSVSADLLFSIYDFYNLLELNPALEHEPLIVGDLGAGWGRLGHVLLQVNPRARYVIFDIPESLLISSLYLPQMLPGASCSSYRETRGVSSFTREMLMSKALWFLASQDLARLPANGVDLMVNVASFQEMEAPQVNRYLEIIDEAAFGGHVYLRNNYIGAASRQDNYRYPQGWLCRFSRNSAFSTQFHEGGWRVT